MPRTLGGTSQFRRDKKRIKGSGRHEAVDVSPAGAAGDIGFGLDTVLEPLPDLHPGEVVVEGFDGHAAQLPIDPPATHPRRKPPPPAPPAG